MAHEKYKHGTEEDLRKDKDSIIRPFQTNIPSDLFLKNYLAANPMKSMYGFTLNRKRPGNFSLCFLANKNSSVQTWVGDGLVAICCLQIIVPCQPIRVTPEAYYLFEAAAVGVAELCDAFKVRHLHESQQRAAGQNGSKTPYGAGLGRTPARPLGAATPGHASVRHVGRTPNPYGAPAAMAGGAPPSFNQNAYSGYQTPRAPNMPPPPGGQPPAMPASSGWGQGPAW